MQQVDFKRPGGPAVAGMDVLCIGAAIVGLGMAVTMMRGVDLKTVVLIFLGFCGTCALGYACLNAWRVPLPTVRPDALVIPAFFGARRIPLGPGHPLGKFLAVSDQVRRRRTVTTDASTYVHFYTLDGRGALTKLVAMRRDAPQLPQVRRALRDVAGLRSETLRQDPASRKVKPDVAHWRGR